MYLFITVNIHAKQCTYLYLFNSRPLETQIKTVVGQCTYLWMISIITHTYYGNFCILYQTNKFLKLGQNFSAEKGKKYLLTFKIFGSPSVKFYTHTHTHTHIHTERDRHLIIICFCSVVYSMFL